VDLSTLVPKPIHAFSNLDAGGYFPLGVLELSPGSLVGTTAWGARGPQLRVFFIRY
jgi:hypothetical protein